MTTSPLRRAIATEAARLLLRRRETNHAAARIRAARWLSRRRVQRDDMPSRREIDDQFALLARLDSAEHHRERLRQLQQSVVELASAFEHLGPRFHGAVVHGPVVPGLEARITVREADWPAFGALLESDPLLRAAVVAAGDEDCRLIHRDVECVVGPREFEDPESVDLAGLRDRVDAEAETWFGPPTEDEPEPTTDYESLRYLLARLEDVRLHPARHPEGDALYHALQVFELGRVERPWDEEFLVACLVHEAGRVVDPRAGHAATLEALEDRVTPRTLWLVEQLPRMHDALGAGRVPKSLRNAADGEELALLARCDREGRVPGAVTCTLDEAIDYLEGLDDQWAD